MVTIKDVAKKAGLSVATVSRFLNKHPYISDEKKKRIQTAITELNYIPSTIATQLRSKKSKTLGILISRITNPFFSYLIDAIDTEAKKAGYQLLIMQTHDDSLAELKMLDYLKQQIVAGIIFASLETKAELIEEYSNYGPIVLCNEQLEGTQIPCVFTDQEKISYEATTYLIQRGYHKIAYCTGGSLTLGGHGQLRARGFERALNEQSLLIKKEWIYKNIHTRNEGMQVAENIIRLPSEERPQAIFCNSDEVAIGVMQTVLSKGLSIPKDLAILGFDNQPSSEMVSVPLTTINQPTVALGIESTKLITALIEGKPYTINQKKLILTLVEREST